ncbi:hypothetical protein AB1L88_05985 [Tautonia sp. JC769]|uniref:hypothetical protein n=1 Tax=Tautonia sp. JC769 TaxID=3232135 RepID=UPI00345AC579
MTEDERWDYLVQLDDELLLGGVILSEWCSFITKEADTAFAKGANLAALLTAVAAIETHLRAESGQRAKARLVDLIDGADIEADLRPDLHRLRLYRNRWVHIDDPWDDADILASPETHEQELASMAEFAMRAMRRVLYSSPWV